MIRPLSIIFILSLFSFNAFSDVVLITYNMAQLKKKGIDFVPCTERRIKPQINNLILDSNAHIYKEKYFALALQEVWTKKAFSALKEAVKNKSFNMFPLEFNDIKQNGVVTITNLKVLEASFTPYTKDSHAKKGMLYILGETENGEKIGILNVHTGYSGNKKPSATHIRQFYEIGEFVLTKKKQSSSFIIAGDFNSGPDLKYDRQYYDVAEAVWDDGILPIMGSVSMSHVDVNGVTWDNTNNPLVNNPTFFLKLVNKIDHGSTGWGQNDSTLDHIFISEELESKQSSIVFNEPVPLHCPKRTSADGKSTLSDHYGVMAVLKSKPPRVSDINP